MTIRFEGEHQAGGPGVPVNNGGQDTSHRNRSTNRQLRHTSCEPDTVHNTRPTEEGVKVFRRRQQPFFTIYRRFVVGGYNATLSASALRVFNVLGMYADNATGESWPSYRTIARWAGLTRRAAINAIAELEAFRLVEVTRRKKFKESFGSNLIRLTEPDEWLTEAEWTCSGKTKFATVSGVQPAQGGEPQFTTLVNLDSPGVVNPSSPKLYENQLYSASLQTASDTKQRGGVGSASAGNPERGDNLPPGDAKADSSREPDPSFQALLAVRDFYLPELNQLERMLKQFPAYVIGPAILAVCDMVGLKNRAGYLRSYLSEIPTTAAHRSVWEVAVSAVKNGTPWPPIDGNSPSGGKLDEWLKRQYPEE